MKKTTIIFQIDIDELIIGSLVKAVMFAAQHHPAELAILSWYKKNHVSLLFVPRIGNSRPNPRYEIDLDGIIIKKISINSPQKGCVNEHAA